MVERLLMLLFLSALIIEFLSLAHNNFATRWKPLKDDSCLFFYRIKFDSNI